MVNLEIYETLFDIILLLCSCALSLIIYFYFSNITPTNIIFHVVYAYCLVIVWLTIKWATFKAKDLGISLLGRNLEDMKVRVIGFSIVVVLSIIFVVFYIADQSIYGTAFSALIPIVYVLAIIRKAAILKDQKRFFYVFYYLFMLIIYGSFIFLGSKGSIIILSILCTFIITLLVFLNLIIIINTISKIIVSVISCIIIILMLLAYINENSEAQILSLLVATIVPIFLSLSCMWVNVDMNYYKKTSALLIFWALMFNLAMKIASQFYEKKIPVCSIFLVYLTIFIGIYLIVADFLCRISEIIDREKKNAIFLSFFLYLLECQYHFQKLEALVFMMF